MRQHLVLVQEVLAVGLDHTDVLQLIYVIVPFGLDGRLGQVPLAGLLGETQWEVGGVVPELVLVGVEVVGGVLVLLLKVLL